MTRRNYYEGELVRFFPEDVDPIDVSSVIKFHTQPDTSIGIVTRKFKDEDVAYFQKKLHSALKIPQEYVSGSQYGSDPWRYEVEWTVPPSQELRFTTGSIVGFSKIQLPANSYFSTGSLVKLK